MRSYKLSKVNKNKNVKSVREKYLKFHEERYEPCFYFKFYYPLFMIRNFNEYKQRCNKFMLIDSFTKAN